MADPLGDPPPPPCFLTGTRIATVAGEVAVEDLRIGDELRLADGGVLPARWIGHRSVSLTFADPVEALPIRVQAGALGQGLPRRDLYVSPCHTLAVDGLLVQARALVNGRSIVQLTQMPADYTYWHIETERHALILAEGAASETLLDTGGRQRFANVAEYDALYPDAPTLAPMDLPRICWRRQLPHAIRQRLDALAATLPGHPTVRAA